MRSLSGCESLATTWEQTSCDGGAFMENFNTSYGVKSRWVRDDDLLYPCTAVAPRHKLYCYLQVTDRLLSATGYDWRRTARECAGAEPGWRATCFQSFGRSASGVSRGNTAELIRLCSIPRGGDRAECVYGAARDRVSNDAGARRAAGLRPARPPARAATRGSGRSSRRSRPRPIAHAPRARRLREALPTAWPACAARVFRPDGNALLPTAAPAHRAR